MRRGFGQVVSFVALFVCLASAAAGQTTSSITGLVQDSAGGVIPGAAVVMTTPNGTKFETVTNSSGAFNVPALGQLSFRFNW